MIETLERVVLTNNLPEQGLRAGDVGTIVLIHNQGEGYEVEFVALDGETIGVVSVYANQVRRVRSGEIAHVRSGKGV